MDLEARLKREWTEREVTYGFREIGVLLVVFHVGAGHYHSNYHTK